MLFDAHPSTTESCIPSVHFLVPRTSYQCSTIWKRARRLANGSYSKFSNQPITLQNFTVHFTSLMHFSCPSLEMQPPPPTPLKGEEIHLTFYLRTCDLSPDLSAPRKPFQTFTSFSFHGIQVFFCLLRLSGAGLPSP